jgi:hypothetical protein
MKKLFPLIGIGLILILGCGEPPWDPGAPSNLTITGDGLKVTLSWTGVSDAEGYNIYFRGVKIATSTTTSWTGTPDSLGNFYVTAYKGDKETSASNTVTTELVFSTTDVTIYERSSAGLSGVGWDSLGKATLYSVAPTSDRRKIDVYLEDFAPGVTQQPFYIARALQLDTTDTSLRNTGIFLHTGTFDKITEAPAPNNYTNYERADTKPYIIYTDDDYFLKIDVSSVGDSSITFKYGFQKVKNYRRLGP